MVLSIDLEGGCGMAKNSLHCSYWSARIVHWGQAMYGLRPACPGILVWSARRGFLQSDWIPISCFLTTFCIITEMFCIAQSFKIYDWREGCMMRYRTYRPGSKIDYFLVIFLWDISITLILWLDQLRTQMIHLQRILDEIL